MFTFGPCVSEKLRSFFFIFFLRTEFRNLDICTHSDLENATFAITNIFIIIERKNYSLKAQYLSREEIAELMSPFFESDAEKILRKTELLSDILFHSGSENSENRLEIPVGKTLK